MRILAPALLAWALSVEAVEFSPECPVTAQRESVEAPATWADQCFAAINGRQPDPDRSGERKTQWRDIDLDGRPERLEVRGVGNAAKQIYVFRQDADGYRYLGRLQAHPTFRVVAMAGGPPVIEYDHRFGADDVRVMRFRYADDRFIEVTE